ncbi:MAG: M23 family metallopeptidase [Oscillospiraceae bacterium]|nr:M23 family metallopeptidase [Oscillospiraceae bacterium]
MSSLSAFNTLFGPRAPQVVAKLLLDEIRFIANDTTRVDPVEVWSLSCRFGCKCEDAHKNFIDGHTGIDLRPQTDGHAGDPILASISGRVTIMKSGQVNTTTDTRNPGNYAMVTSLDDSTQTHYLHLDEILVRNRQLVRAGQQIGTMGNTGYSLGSHQPNPGTHLHFEVRIWNNEEEKYKAINPLIFLGR